MGYGTIQKTRPLFTTHGVVIIYVHWSISTAKGNGEIKVKIKKLLIGLRLFWDELIFFHKVRIVVIVKFTR